MTKYFTIILLTFVIQGIVAQTTNKDITGRVTYVTANNVYVRFNDTNSIEQGAILKVNGANCLQVSQKSSSSVVCVIINDCLVTVDDLVIATITEANTPPPTDVVIEETEKTSETPSPIKKEENESEYTENIRGRISVGSFGILPNERESRSTFLTRFALSANNISNSKFSLEANIAYRALTSTPEDFEGRKSILGIYNLHVTYDVYPDLLISAGRKINPKAATVGANDGLMVEKYFGNFYAGAFTGFRPDIYDYGFNTNLFQYGGYFGIESKTSEYYGQTTLGAVQQTNNGNTDRNYLFFQHNSTINSNFNLFGAMELDLYSTQGNATRLTNLFLSARYRFSKNVNAFVSYDSRKQIIYYESFQTQIEQLLDDDLARQGLRLRLNVRPAKIVWLGASYSKRFQSDSQNQSDNIYAYATLTRIPKISGRLNLSFNTNTSRYLTSNILSGRYSREIIVNNLQADIYYRRADYKYNSIEGNFIQNYYGGGLSYNFSKNWQFSLSGEVSTLEEEQFTRFYLRLTKRFYTKK